MSNKLIDLDIKLLRALIALSEHKTMRDAGKSLHTSEGGIFQRLNKLEVKTGKPVYVRNGRGCKITPHGEFLLGHARIVVGMNDQIVKIMNSN